MYNNYKCVAIVQARMTSSRLPGKVLLPLGGKSVLQNIIERLRLSKYIDDVVIATTTNQADDAIIELCDSLNCSYYRGSEDDVLSRVLEVAKKFETDIIVEVTADCPCIDAEITDLCIGNLVENKTDYFSNVVKRTMPRGLDVQAFTLEALERANEEVDNDIDRQHVSTWIYKNPKGFDKYKVGNFSSDNDYSHIRLTLDTEDDYNLLKFVYDAFPDNEFKSDNMIRLIKWYPELFELNKHIPQKSYYEELVGWYKENGTL